MANGTADLGNGLGYIYAVEAGDTSKFWFCERNDVQGARNAKSLAVAAVALSLNKRAVGQISVSSVTGSGNITAINIDGVNQINTNIAYVAGSTSDVAANIATGMNSFTPGSGYNFEAVAIASKVYVYAPVDAGSAPNGKAITVSNTGNLTTVQQDMNGGSNNTTIYDTESGFRFYVNADYSGTAVPGSLTNALEISDDIIPRGLNQAFDRQSATIASGIVTITRKSSITVLTVDTQGGAASDDLDSIIFNNAADGDIILLRGASDARIVTVTAAGNINRVNSFSTDGSGTQIGLMFIGGELSECFRSGSGSVPSVASFRTAGIPITSAYGRTTLAPADNTTDTVTPNSSKNVQRVEGSATLTTGDYIVNLVTTGAIAGDEFFIPYYGNVTVGSFGVTIEGVALTDEEALLGGVIVHYIYDGAWRFVGKYYDISEYEIQSDNIANGVITTAKLATANTYEVITIPVSFEANEVGDVKVLIPYPCSVTNTYSSVSKTVAGTDDGTIVFKNNAGTTMTGATITVAASSAVGTADTGLATANNTFTAGQVMTLTTAKTTAGGRCVVSVQLVRA